MLLNDEQYTTVWNKVYRDLQFNPTTDTRFIPFSINAKHIVFDISQTNEDVIEIMQKLISNAFIKCISPGEKMYALDWHHSAFLFDPRKPEDQQDIYLGKNPYLDGSDLYAHFPGYYPDGDYFFFIDEQFKFGYLSHPWREEVWIFGESLVSEFNKIYKILGWTIKETL